VKPQVDRRFGASSLVTESGRTIPRLQATSPLRTRSARGNAHLTGIPCTLIVHLSHILPERRISSRPHAVVIARHEMSVHVECLRCVLVAEELLHRLDRAARPFMATGEYPIECEVWIVAAATLSEGAKTAPSQSVGRFLATRKPSLIT
jgi:hypothetical protein